MVPSIDDWLSNGFPFQILIHNTEFRTQDGMPKLIQFNDICPTMEIELSVNEKKIIKTSVQIERSFFASSVDFQRKWRLIVKWNKVNCKKCLPIFPSGWLKGNINRIKKLID